MKDALFLVDDDNDDVELALLGLRAAGFPHRVLTARDGAEALEQLRRAYETERILPAAVATDIKMPKMDGLELLRRLKGDPRLRYIPVVVLTSSGREEDRTEALRLGARLYLQKPEDLEGYGEIARLLLEVMTTRPPL